ncbi:catalase [Variovorax sp. dw_954]|uniref:catalase n=1 Tax=Variovorax sp. dw_954 TaxID=2720078 RepID=UPI001BD204E1|nr:catalase [Variovorax sp. dw_954]
MQQDITAAQMLDAFKEDAPGHLPDTRWAHTHGLGVMGHFVASEVARDFCSAGHFQGQSVPVTARFSNGSSDPERHDERPDTRGLAVKFHVSDSIDHDLLSMTMNVFGARTREEFLGVSKAFVPKPVQEESWFRRTILDPLMLRNPLPPMPPGVTISGGPGLAQYAGSHDFARAFTIEGGLLQVPVSWARTAYHAVHTFMAVGPDGVRRPVRFSWQPIDGVFPVPADQQASKATDFLTPEMRARLAKAPARFTLKMAIGDPGDALDDPSMTWPVTRQTVSMGTLFIEQFAQDRGVDVDRLSFNPMRLPPGIEASDDPILHARGEIYQLGCKERGGIGCPLHAARALSAVRAAVTPSAEVSE